MLITLALAVVALVGLFFVCRWFVTKEPHEQPFVEPMEAEE